MMCHTVFSVCFNVWLGTVPTEFQTTKICTDEQVRLNPESNCMTIKSWKEGIVEYYANGGGGKE